MKQKIIPKHKKNEIMEKPVVLLPLGSLESPALQKGLN